MVIFHKKKNIDEGERMRKEGVVGKEREGKMKEGRNRGKIP